MIESTSMFIAALFTIAKCPPVNEQIKKLWYIYTMEHYSAVKEKETLPFVTAKG